MDRYILPICCLLVFAGCKKKENNEPSRVSEVTYDFEYRIENKSFPPLNYRVYSSVEDYRNNVNPLISARVEWNSDTVIQFHKQKVLDTLYYDVFSDDYRYTNWSNSGSINVSKNSFAFKELMSGFNMHQFVAEVGNLREIFFEGDKWSTEWRAVDLFDIDTNSVWSTTPENQRFREIVLTRDRQFAEISKNSNGIQVIESGMFSVVPLSQQWHIRSLMLGSGNTFKLLETTSDITHLSTSYSLDTVLLFDQVNHWMMVKKK